MLTIWSIAVKETLHHFLRFLLAILFTWLVARITAGEVAQAPVIAQTGLLITCLPNYPHAAAQHCRHRLSRAPAMAVCVWGYWIDRNRSKFMR